MNTGGCSSSSTVSGGVAGDHGGVDLALEVPGGEVVDGVVAETGDPEVERHVAAAYPCGKRRAASRRNG